MVPRLAAGPVELRRRAGPGRRRSRQRIAAGVGRPASHLGGAVLRAVRDPGPTATPLLALAGTFTGADEFHFGRGTAKLIETEPGRFVVRLEKFEVRNGPDLFVYLSPSADGYAKGAIEIGRLKADKGNQNYELPAGTDVSSAASIVIWCRQFSVLFATAPLDAG